MIRKNRGVSLVSLVVTIIVLLILSTIIIQSTYTGADYKQYKLMSADVGLLYDKIRIYYNKYGELPIIEDLSDEEAESVRNNLNLEPENTAKVDVSKLGGITLNFGDLNDIFIINKETFEVYYLNGIEFDGKMYYKE